MDMFLLKKGGSEVKLGGAGSIYLDTRKEIGFRDYYIARGDTNDNDVWDRQRFDSLTRELVLNCRER